MTDLPTEEPLAKEEATELTPEQKEDLQLSDLMEDNEDWEILEFEF